MAHSSYPSPLAEALALAASLGEERGVRGNSNGRRLTPSPDEVAGSGDLTATGSLLTGEIRPATATKLREIASRYCLVSRQLWTDIDAPPTQIAARSPGDPPRRCSALAHQPAT